MQSGLQRLVLLGALGNNADLLDAIDAVNAVRPTYEVLGYVHQDGRPTPKVSLPFLGDFGAVRSLPEDVHLAGFAFGVRTYRTWPETVTSLGLPVERFETVIHPRAYVSPRSTVGRGSILLAGTTVGADATIGNHVVILQNVCLSHDDAVEDYACLTVGVTCSGGIRIGRNCFVGTSATLGASVGEGSLVGAGTLVRHEVPPGEVWVGNPGRFLRKA